MSTTNNFNVSPTERMLEVIERYTADQMGILPLLDKSITFASVSPQELARRFAEDPESNKPVYGRLLHPTVAVLGEMLAALEGSEAGYGVASGLAAIQIVVNELAKPGDHIVVGNTLYAGSVGFFNSLWRERRVRVTKVDISDAQAVTSALRKKRTKLLYVESVSNPMLCVADIPLLASLAHYVGAALVVDNTFAPFIIQPIKHGADIVVHSLTKYAGGYSDLIAGGICCSNEFWRSILHASKGMHTFHGAVLDATTAHTLLLRMQDMHLRFREASQGAYVLAQCAERHGAQVLYPGLESNSEYKLMERITRVENVRHSYGFGGVLSLDCGTQERAAKFHSELIAHRVAVNAVSLGSVHTYAICLGSKLPPLTRSKAARSFAQVPPGIIRIAVGRAPESGVLLRRFEEMFDSDNWG